MSEPSLTDFLLARIAEDEAGYRAEAAGIEWLTVNGRDLWPKLLADCEAKRRIVEREGKRLHEEWRRRSDEHRQTFEEWFTKPYGETLRDLALPYADHSDYREDWRP